MSVKETWDRLLQPVESLNAQKQFTFATFSCARAAGYYNQYCEREACRDPNLLEEVLSAAWAGTRGIVFQTGRERFKERLDAASTELEESGSVEAIAAQEACFAAMVVLEILTSPVSPEQTLRVAHFTRDIVDMIVQERTNFDSSKDVESAVLGHPVMQQELQLHARALELLRSADLSDSVVSALAELSAS
jgi:uncharacterized protein YjaG (DUF416 family)